MEKQSHLGTNRLSTRQRVGKSVCDQGNMKLLVCDCETQLRFTFFPFSLSNGIENCPEQKTESELRCRMVQSTSTCQAAEIIGQRLIWKDRSCLRKKITPDSCSDQGNCSTLKIISVVGEGTQTLTRDTGPSTVCVSTELRVFKFRQTCV